MKKKILIILLFLIPIIFLSQTNIDKIKSENYLKRGLVLYNFLYYQKSNFYLKKSLEYNSRNYIARYFLGWSYFKSGFLQNALFEWENLKSLGYKDDLLDNMLNNIYFQEGNIAKSKIVNDYTFYSKIDGKKLQSSFFLWPLGMTIDPKNNIFISGHRSYNVLLMNNGQIEKSINIFGEFLGYPYDVAYDNLSHTLYVTDFKNDSVIHMTTSGKILNKIGENLKGNQKLIGPSGIDIDDDGNLYVVDQGNNRVVKFDKNGKFLFSFGDFGKEKGYFFRPIDIVYDKYRKQLYISNSYSNRVDIFDLWGNYISSIGEKFLENPKGLFLYKDNPLYIADSNGVYYYDFENRSINKVNLGNYKFDNPYFILIDKNQNLILSEPYKNYVDYFVPKNQLYLNLDVKLEHIDIRSYPLIVCYISVKDQSGNPIYGLKDANFSFQEGDQIITRVNSDYSKTIENYKALSIVIDSSKSMEKKKNEVVKLLEQIFTEDKGSINYNLFWSFKINQVTDFSYSKEVIRNDISNKNNYEGNNYVDIALYDSITAFFRKFVKGGLIFITDGNFTNDSFQTYSQNDIINYAKNNYIPVYIFYFGDGKGRTFLKELATKTSGMFFEKDDLLHPERVLDKFENYQSPVYIVYYKTPYTYSEDYFRKVFVTVQYNGRVGKNWLGYYMPEK